MSSSNDDQNGAPAASSPSATESGAAVTPEANTGLPASGEQGASTATDSNGAASAAPGESAEAAAAAERSRRAMRLRLVALGSALVGMVFGAVVEMFVQGAMESTGWFGPTLDTLIEQQESNFKDLRAKLEALKSSDDPAERARLERELEMLIAAQEKLATRTHIEFRDYQAELADLKKQLLAAGSGVGGADFWVAEGESVAVGERQNVVGLLRAAGNVNYVTVSFGGKRHTLNPGESLDVPVKDGTGKLIFKLKKDDRAGFDYVPPKQ